MNVCEYRLRQKTLKDPVIYNIDYNPIPSDTDPTQDMPVKNIEFGINGVPVNVKVNRNLSYNNLPIEKMTSIDRRNNDAFDSVGELRSLENGATKSLKSKS